MPTLKAGECHYSVMFVMREGTYSILLYSQGMGGITSLCYFIQGVPKGGVCHCFLTYVEREVPMLFYSYSIVLKGRVSIRSYSVILVQGRGVALFYSNEWVPTLKGGMCHYSITFV